jgi:hypothetical protein
MNQRNSNSTPPRFANGIEAPRKASRVDRIRKSGGIREPKRTIAPTTIKPSTYQPPPRTSRVDMVLTTEITENTEASLLCGLLCALR